FSSRRRHTRFSRDWSSDVCSSDLVLHLSVNYVCFKQLVTEVDDGSGLLDGQQSDVHDGDERGCGCRYCGWWYSGGSFPLETGTDVPGYYGCDCDEPDGLPVEFVPALHLGVLGGCSVDWFRSEERR